MDKYLLALLFLDLAGRLLDRAGAPDPTPEDIAKAKQDVDTKLAEIKKRIDSQT